MINSSVNGRVATIEMNRVKANAYNAEFMQQLNSAIDQCNNNSDVSIVRVQSALPGFFCAGADIKDFSNNDTSTNKTLVALANRATSEMNRSDKLYVAIIQGHTLGGGLELALACDIRLAADADYLIGMSEVKLGLIPGNGGSQRLTRAVGVAHCLEMCVSGKNIGPKRAHQIGLIHQLYSSDSFEQQANAYCNDLANGAPLAMAALKKAIYQGAAMPLNEALTLETHLADSLYDTYDAKEGFDAFIEKRPAKFEAR